eukprot:scaffold39313_cov46-Prasinocladus_malaysianus.AAC.2
MRGCLALDAGKKRGSDVVVRDGLAGERHILIEARKLDLPSLQHRTLRPKCGTEEQKSDETPGNTSLWHRLRNVGDMIFNRLDQNSKNYNTQRSCDFARRPGGSCSMVGQLGKSRRFSRVVLKAPLGNMSERSRCPRAERSYKSVLCSAAWRTERCD